MPCPALLLQHLKINTRELELGDQFAPSRLGQPERPTLAAELAKSRACGMLWVGVLGSGHEKPASQAPFRLSRIMRRATPSICAISRVITSSQVIRETYRNCRVVSSLFAAIPLFFVFVYEAPKMPRC